MTLLDVMGQFWLATKPDNKVPGRLTIDEENNAKLDLLSSLYEMADAFRFDDQPVRILGNSGGKAFTIDRCFRVPLSGINTNEKYSSPLVLEGIHFDENEAMEFDSLTVKPNYLEQWVWMTGVSVDGNNEDFSLRISQNESMKQAINGGEISLDFYAGYSGEIVGTKIITDSCTFRVNFYDRSPAERFFGTASRLQDLITLGVGKPASIVHADLNRGDIEVPCQLYTVWRAKANQPDPRGIAPNRMVFSFRDIGEIDGVARWLDNSQRLNSVIAPLRSYWYTSDLDVETRFIVLFIAAEALDRVLLGNKNTRERRRINNLVQKVDRIFSPVIDDVSQWVNEVCNVRDEFIHHDSIHDQNQEPIDYMRSYFLGESLYFLIVLCILQACGIPEDCLMKIRANSRFRQSVDYLRGKGIGPRI